MKFSGSGDLLWSRIWDGGGFDEAFSVIQASTGDLILVGALSTSGAETNDPFIMKFTSSGTLTWAKTYSNSTGADEAYDVVEASNGDFVIASTSYIARFDTNGALVWDNSWSDMDTALSVVRTGDNGFVIIGETSSLGAGSVDAMIIKFNSDGTKAWAETWGSTAYDHIKDLKSSSDGGFYITGDSSGFGLTNSKAFIAKLNSDGSSAWARAWGGQYYDYGMALSKTSDDGVILAGNTSSYGDNSHDLFIAKYTSAGLINTCSATMCKTITPVISSQTVTMTDVVSTVGTPTVNVSNPAITVSSPTATMIVVVAP